MKNGIMQQDGFGNKRWYVNDLLHRTDGPAVKYVDGYKEWWLNGQCHRTDGPARDDTHGNKQWYLRGKRHRLDGPAIELISGYKAWWMNDEYYGSGNIPPTEYTLASLIYEGISE